MRTTCILNLKGGVAKTSTAVNMAAILAVDYEKRVLVIDADSQSNSTEFYGGAAAGQCTLADMLRRVEVNEAIRPSSFAGIDLLPADDSLMDLDLSKAEDQSVDIACIKRKLNARADKYDYVIVDCPPAFNAATAAALVAADDVVIPIKLDAFSLRGMGNLMRQIANMRKINKNLRLAGLLPTMCYKSESISEAMAELKKSGLPVFRPIRRTPKVDDMTFAQEPLIKSSPKSAACIDYRRFVTEYIGGGARE